MEEAPSSLLELVLDPDPAELLSSLSSSELLLLALSLEGATPAAILPTLPTQQGPCF